MIFRGLNEIRVFVRWLNSEPRDNIDLNQLAHDHKDGVFCIFYDKVVAQDVNHYLKNVLRRQVFLESFILVRFVKQPLTHVELEHSSLHHE
jgi:hypothetical protein